MRRFNYLSSESIEAVNKVLEKIRIQGEIDKIKKKYKIVLCEKTTLLLDSKQPVNIELARQILSGLYNEKKYKAKNKKEQFSDYYSNIMKFTHKK